MIKLNQSLTASQRNTDELSKNLEDSRTARFELLHRQVDLKQELQKEKAENLQAKSKALLYDGIIHDLKAEKTKLIDENSCIQAQLDSFQASAAQLKRAEEYTRLALAMEEQISMLELANDLQAQDLRDTERRHAEESRRQQLQEEAEQQRARKAEMHHRVLQRREVRSQLRAKQEKWNIYSAAWQDFESTYPPVLSEQELS